MGYAILRRTYQYSTDGGRSASMASRKMRSQLYAGDPEYHPVRRRLRGWSRRLSSETMIYSIQAKWQNVRRDRSNEMLKCALIRKSLPLMDAPYRRGERESVNILRQLNKTDTRFKK